MNAADSGLGFVWRVLGPHRRHAVVVLACVLADTVLASLGVGMVLPVFQSLLAPDHHNALLARVFPGLSGLAPDARLAWVAGGTVLLFLAKAAVSYTATVVSQGFLLRLRFHWVDRIGAYYLRGPFLRLVSRKQGELLNDWFNETLAASRFFQSTLTWLSSGALATALVLLGLAVNWKAMAALLAGGAVVVVVLRQRLFGRAAGLSQVKLRHNQAITAAMAEDLAQARDVKLLGAEGLRLGQLAEACDRLRHALLRGAVMAESPRILGEFLAVVALMAFVVLALTVMRLPPEEILPVLAFFFVASYRLISATSLLLSARVKALNELQSVRLVHRLVTEAEAEAAGEARGGGAPIDAIETDIVFRGVAFTHADGKQALECVDARIPRGSMTVLVGASGSGKSTLLDLLMRLMVPAAGSIEANGRDAADFDLAAWRTCFGYVSQEAALFNGSIRMNLRLASPGASDAALEEACRLAGAHDFIAALPDRYDTVVGDRGFTLSGGQRKRIAIARALLRRPSVLILDEATTAFEHSLERTLLRGLRGAMPGLTLLQVTHRLQALDDADWVIALEHGRVVATGARDAVAPALSSLHIASGFA